MTAIVLRGDARALPLADASVDLIVTSPPYFGLRSYQDGGEHYDGQIGAEATPWAYLDALWECTAEWTRVLKPSGSLWINLGDKYSTYEGPRTVRAPEGSLNARLADASQEAARKHTKSAPTAYGVAYKSLMGLPWRYAIGCMDKLGLILRRDLIWSKPNGLPESVTDRCRTSHEYWFHFTRRPRYFSALDEIREPLAAPRRAAGATAFGARNVSIERTGTGEYVGQNPAGKVPGSVWEIASQPLRVPAELEVDHFAAFPMEFPRRIISGWSPAGGLVVDPFGGTGTTALVADVLGRRGISVDMSADYCRLAKWRTTNRGRARALGLPKPKPAPEGMDSLFDEFPEIGEAS